jgi:hypothetical protein
VVAAVTPGRLASGRPAAGVVDVAETVLAGNVAETVSAGRVAETVMDGTRADTFRGGMVAETVVDGTLAETVVDGIVAETVAAGIVADTLVDGAVAETLVTGDDVETEGGRRMPRTVGAGGSITVEEVEATEVVVSCRLLALSAPTLSGADDDPVTGAKSAPPKPDA